MITPSQIKTPSLQFSGHETFPLRQLWLRKAFDNIVSCKGEAPKAIFADEESIVRFGVGRNMVTSIRHWTLACGFMVEGPGGGYVPTDLCKALLSRDGLDPYLERPNTAWLIHWKLAGIGRKSTTWWWVFNCIVQQTFEKESLFGALSRYCAVVPYKVSDSTLRRDIDVCIASYLPRTVNSNAEDAAEPILSELPLLQQHAGAKGMFSFRRGPKSSLPDALFAYAVLEFWERHPESSVLSFEKIVHDYGSPGRVFKLDEHSIGERVGALEHLTKGAFRWTDNSGVRQISKTSGALPPSLKTRLLESCYA